MIMKSFSISDYQLLVYSYVSQIRLLALFVTLWLVHSDTRLVSPKSVQSLNLPNGHPLPLIGTAGAGFNGGQESTDPNHEVTKLTQDLLQIEEELTASLQERKTRCGFSLTYATRHDRILFFVSNY